MPQLDISVFPTQLFWLALIFVALYLILWKVALPRVTEVRESRQVRIESDLEKAHELFPDTRRAIMYTPMDVRDKPVLELRADLERIAAVYGPCDIVFADIEDGTPDEKVHDLWRICAEISETPGAA